MGCGCGFDLGRGPQRLMRTGITLITLGHLNFILGAIVHGSVLRHVANPERTVTSEYTTANIISVGSGLLHWALLCVSLLNCLLSAACSLGLALAISLTVASRGHRLILGCNSSALPADARAAIATNDCPFDTTRLYDTALALWFPSMVMAAGEAALSGRCCVVALILRRVGPWAHSSSCQQHGEEPAPKELAAGAQHKQETRQLLAPQGEAQA
ncbi:keratinocyte-associated protein 3 isoform X2 [Pelodiscus sinensis]|uniref:keratinocyte-associated protein 3 isoform X2 n=1 Tax=Pelodiscus sinensis TaxID=13735 RepID=UPI003F6B1A71